MPEANVRGVVVNHVSGDRPSSAPSQQPNLADLPSVLQKVVAERDALRAQNDQLWKIIEKQRTAIQQLQKKALDRVDPPSQGQRKSSYSEGMPLQDPSSFPSSPTPATTTSSLDPSIAPSSLPSSILPPMAITEVQSAASHPHIPAPLDLSPRMVQEGSRKKSASTSSLVDTRDTQAGPILLTLAEPTPPPPPPQ
ncbi:hypothetical protein BJ684DRAFT_20220, partial [Piptocephalis cylindrospora]